MCDEYMKNRLKPLPKMFLVTFYLIMITSRKEKKKVTLNLVPFVSNLNLENLALIDLNILHFPDSHTY